MKVFEGAHKGSRDVQQNAAKQISGKIMKKETEWNFLKDNFGFNSVSYIVQGETSQNKKNELTC